MKIDVTIVPLHPRTPFRISRGEKHEVRNVFVRVVQDEFLGYGESSPNAFYHESADNVAEKIQDASSAISRLKISTPEDVKEAWRGLSTHFLPSRAAQCAVDLALWDLAGKIAGQSVADLAGAGGRGEIVSFCTIGLGSIEELREKLGEIRDFPRIKLKVEESNPLETARLARSMSNAMLAVDANCAWGALDIPDLSRSLSDLGVAFIEQPLPPSEDRRMHEILEACALPIMADESCALPADLERLPGRFSGFNIKLVKCGGLTPALQMLRRGKELGLQVMVGCMLESSLLISAGAVAGATADFADLDGAWLLEDDPFDGLRFDRGEIRLPLNPGFGMCPRGSMFPDGC